MKYAVKLDLNVEIGEGGHESWEELGHVIHKLEMLLIAKNHVVRREDLRNHILGPNNNFQIKSIESIKIEPIWDYNLKI